MRLTAILMISLMSAGIAPPKASGFERVGIGWCDRLLDRYDHCLRSITRRRCEAIARESAAEGFGLEGVMHLVSGNRRRV